MRKLTEIAYFTDDVEAMTRFYTTLLGTVPVTQSDDMAIFIIGETKLFIHRNYDPGEEDLPPENHIAFAVEDVASTCQSLTQHELTIERPPRDYYWGRSAYLRDPDGHLIELTQISEQA